MKNQILESYKYPIALYLWGVFELLFTLFLFIRNGFSMDILGVLFSFSFLFYYLTSRYACRVIVYGDRCIVKYFAFWNTDIEIKFNKIKSVDYLKSYFDLNAHLNNQNSFKLICHDTLILRITKELINIPINTRFKGFDKLRKIIEFR